TVRNLEIPKLPASVPTPNHNQPPPWRSNELATTLKGNQPAPLAGVIVPSLAPLKATPTATTAGVVAPPARPHDLAASTVPFLPAVSDAQAAQFVAEKTTARQPALDEPPSPMRRILVAGSAAALLIAIALTLALWPSATPSAEPQPQPPATGATVTPLPTGAAVTAKPGMAILQINVDAVADITV